MSLPFIMSQFCEDTKPLVSPNTALLATEINDFRETTVVKKTTEYALQSQARLQPKGASVATYRLGTYIVQC